MVECVVLSLCREGRYKVPPYPGVHFLGTQAGTEPVSVPPAWGVPNWPLQILTSLWTTEYNP